MWKVFVIWLIFCYPDPFHETDLADQTERDPKGSGFATLRKGVTKYLILGASNNSDLKIFTALNKKQQKQNKQIMKHVMRNGACWDMLLNSDVEDKIRCLVVDKFFRGGCTS